MTSTNPPRTSPRRHAGGVSRSALYLALAVAATLVLAACGASSSQDVSFATIDTPSSGGGAASGLVLEVPDVTLSAYQGGSEIGGDEVLLSEVLGQGKPVVLNFWAALCPPCRAEMPDIQRVHDARGHEVTVLGVDIGPQQFLGSREDAKQLLADLELTYPVATTFDESVVRDFRIVGMPTTFFLRADGSLLRAWSGLLNEEKINEFVDELIDG